MPDRGQLSTTLMEAAVATTLIFGVTAFILVAGGNGEPTTESRTLDRFAGDVTHLLTATHDDPHVTTVLATNATFDQYRSTLDTRIRSMLPAGYYYRLETRYGSVGAPKPSHVDTGYATLELPNATVELWVWAP